MDRSNVDSHNFTSLKMENFFKNNFHLENNVVVKINITAVHKHLCTTSSMCPIKDTYSKYNTPIKPHQKDPKEVKSKPLLNSCFIDNFK